MMKNRPKVDMLSLEEIARIVEEYPELDALSLDVYNQLTRTTRMFVLELDRAAQVRRRGLSVGRNVALYCIMRYPGEDGITPAEIAEALNVTRATVTGLLNTLEKEGLIIRTPSDEDRRKIHIRPSRKAFEAIRDEWPESSLDITTVMSGLTEREKSQLLKALSKIRRGIAELRRSRRS
jgi:DNA-binding MarR family transcriptional regulator